MPENPYQPPKEVNEVRPWRWAKYDWLGAIILGVIGLLGLGELVILAVSR